MPAAMREFLLSGIGLGADDLYEVPGMLDLTSLWQIATLDIPELRDPPWTPVVPARLVPADEGEQVDVFAAIRQGDLLVHHPYESFTASVERFITQAADDPDVLSIKQTLYRTSGDSPIVRDLIRAADQGKQVVVLVEIKARFDEEANIVWARKLEQAGAHVVYGLVGLKTHSKVALVVRREGSGLRRYLHLGTGNYNPKTARLYTDLGLLTCRPELGADATDLFNYLTGLSRQEGFRRLLVAPDHAPAADPRPHRPRDGPCPGRPAGADRGQGQRPRGPRDDRAPLRGEPGGRRDRLHRPRRLQPPPRASRDLRADPRPLDHRRVPRAQPDPRLRQRRPAGVVHGLGRPDGAQPRPPRRGRLPDRGPRGQGADRGDRGRHARRRSPLVAAGRGRRVAAHGGDPRGAGLARHLRDPQGARAGHRLRARSSRHAAVAPSGSLDPRA